MPDHLDTGLAGEALAAAHLEKLGYRIAARNWRAGRGELDIIAWNPENVLIFIEVKTRSLDGFGGPEEAVDRKKQDQIARTAGAYMESIDYEAEIRFDIISVLLRGNRLIALKHMEDAFFPGL
jgi:putative endonuclease